MRAGIEARAGATSRVRRGLRRRGAGSPARSGQQTSGLKRGQTARGRAHGGVVLAAVQCAGSRGVGEAFEHRATCTRRGEDDRGRVREVWWWRGLLDDAVAVLDEPHRLFDPLYDTFDPQSDGARASGSPLLVGGSAACLRAPRAWTAPAERCGQLGVAARSDGLVEHIDTLRQFRTDERSLAIRDLNARGVWFVGWSKTVGAGGLWWEALGRESGCVGAVGDWETWDVDNWGQGDVVGDGRDAG
jgi:hypothetical protein